MSFRALRGAVFCAPFVFSEGEESPRASGHEKMIGLSVPWHRCSECLYSCGKIDISPFCMEFAGPSPEVWPDAMYVSCGQSEISGLHEIE